jgi:uncharacterized repeat protein (TIGR01451 family)
VVKGFNPTLVTGGSVSRLTVTIGNPAAYTQTGIAFTDNMPAGMTIGAPANPTTTCTGGTFSGATLGSGVWSFSGGSVAANSSCTVSVNATSNVDGNLTNTIPIGGVTTANGASNIQAASASLSNLPGMSVSKSFSPNPTVVNQAVRLTITVTNSSATTALSQLAFNDDLTLGGTQTGLTVSPTPNMTNTCNGTVSTTATSIRLAGGSLATQASCRVDIDMVTNTVGSYTNTIPMGTLTTLQGVTNGVPGTDTLPVHASIRVANQLSPTGDIGRFVFTLTPSATVGASVRTNVGNDVTPSAVTPFFAAAGTTYTLTETGQGLTDPANYVTTYRCANADNTTLASGTGTTVSVTPPTTASGATKNQQDITCIFTNTRKSLSATVILSKTWAGATLNDAVNITGTGLTTLASVANTANKTDTGVTDTVATGSVISIAESFTTGSAANYASSLSCTGTTGLSGNVLTIGAADTAIVCTMTNTALGAGGASIAGTVFNDNGVSGGVANNGVQDGAEVGLANVMVTANQAGCTNSLCGTAITDGAGHYKLVLPASVTGAITLTETNLNGMLSTGGSAGTTGGTYTRTTDTTAATIASGVTYTGVNFADVPDNQFMTDGVKSALPSAVVFYPHQFIAGTAGSVAFSLGNIATPATLNWSELIYQDTNCNAVIDSGDPVVPAAVSVTAGQIVCLLVKEFVPANAPINAQNALTVNANFTATFSGTAVAYSYVHHDTTTVGQDTATGLSLVKAASTATALPGTNITYTITYTNNSTGALSTVVINDATPAYTLYQGASCGTLPLNFTACNITAPAVGATGSIVYTFTGTLAPAVSGTVNFTVQVQP